MSGSDSVGTLLAAIATSLSDALRILSFADKRQWGPDEQEQLRALELVLDQAKRDFQQMSALVNGQTNYEHDRKHETLEELRALATRFRAHTQDIKGWIRSGGPINPIWIRETHHLQRELHRAQCRAARRIFISGQEVSIRCLGAFLVHRKQRAWAAGQVVVDPQESHRRNMEELIACRYAGGFERLGDQDIAFVCDFCDGHLIWEDLESVPTSRSAQELAGSTIAPVSSGTDKPYWQARGLALSTGEQKEIVFAPVAIANHVPPEPAGWQARLICPLCEEEGARPQDKDDDEDAYHPDYEFEDLVALQEHLEWTHTSTALPASLPISAPATNNCLIM